MSTRPAPDFPAPGAPPRLLASPLSHLAGRGAVEGYLDRLNQASPVIERRITRWGGEQDALSVGAVLLTPLGGPTAGDAFMGECQCGFDLEMHTRNPGAAPAAYAIALPLAGEMGVTLAGRDFTARAGEGVIVDPADVERTRVGGGTHFVEFLLPKSDVARLADAWSPGVDGRAPHFAPALSSTLAPRLLYMAGQAAAVLQAPGHPAGARLLFQRWTEMIALTLLHEQDIDNSLARRPAASAPAPACVRRAIDFMQAHADAAIGLADIAEAAHTSASSLLRHFRTHLGLTPYGYLRTVRLERARAALLADSPEPVRDIALRWGFQNASKFSQAYAAHFGERPSDTRSRA